MISGPLEERADQQQCEKQMSAGPANVSIHRETFKRECLCAVDEMPARTLIMAIPDHHRIGGFTQNHADPHVLSLPCKCASP
jgi:hypothetical protein